MQFGKIRLICHHLYKSIVVIDLDITYERIIQFLIVKLRNIELC